MDDINNRKFVGRLIYVVLTERKNVREAIKLFPETNDRNIECAYHALVHYAADEEMLPWFESQIENLDYGNEEEAYLHLQHYIPL